MENGEIKITPENVSRTLGREAQKNNILAAKLIADVVKTTLGPKGMDKMLVDPFGNITVTNDGVTILEEMEIEHPAAKMMVEIAKTQETEVGDGTTTAVMIAGSLLQSAERLIENDIHPTIIVKGYKIASEKAISILNEISIPLKDSQTLESIAMTAMTGKGAEGNKEVLSKIVVQSIEQIASLNTKLSDINLDDIRIEKIKGEKVADSELVRGIVLNKGRANAEMPLKIDNAKILLVDFPVELKNPETETNISISSPEQLESFIQSEERHIKEITNKIILSGCNVLICQKGIDDVAQYYLARAGIFALRRIDKSDIEKIARAVSGKVVSNINEISALQLGKAQTVEEIKQGDDSLTYIRGCDNPKTVTLVIRGSSSHVLDETARAVTDGLGDVLSALKSGKVVPGGGAIEIELARRLRLFARTIQGKEQIAIDEFASCLESIPKALAENAGLNPQEIIIELRKRHDQGLLDQGLNLFTDKIEDTFKAGIIEPMKVKTQAINSATEVATMILRIDDVLISKPKEQKPINYQEFD